MHAAGLEAALPGAQGEALQLSRAAVRRGRDGPAGSAAAQALQPHQQQPLADGGPGRQQGPLPGEGRDKCVFAEISNALHVCGFLPPWLVLFSKFSVSVVFQSSGAMTSSGGVPGPSWDMNR